MARRQMHQLDTSVAEERIAGNKQGFVPPGGFRRDEGGGGLGTMTDLFSCRTGNSNTLLARHRGQRRLVSLFTTGDGP